MRGLHKLILIVVVVERLVSAGTENQSAHCDAAIFKLNDCVPVTVKARVLPAGVLLSLAFAFENAFECLAQKVPRIVLPEVLQEPLYF